MGGVERVTCCRRWRDVGKHVGGSGDLGKGARLASVASISPDRYEREQVRHPAHPLMVRPLEVPSSNNLDEGVYRQEMDDGCTQASTHPSRKVCVRSNMMRLSAIVGAIVTTRDNLWQPCSYSCSCSCSCTTCEAGRESGPSVLVSRGGGTSMPCELRGTLQTHSLAQGRSGRC